MKVEIRNALSMKLVPENDADRAILASWSSIKTHGSARYLFSVQSHTWGDGKIEDLVFGFSKFPDAVAD